MHESDLNGHDMGELSFGAVAMDRAGQSGREGGQVGTKHCTTMIKSSQGLTCATSIPLTGPAAAGTTPHPLLLKQRRHLSLSGGDGKAKARGSERQS